MEFEDIARGSRGHIREEDSFGPLAKSIAVVENRPS